MQGGREGGRVQCLQNQSERLVERVNFSILNKPESCSLEAGRPRGWGNETGVVKELDTQALSGGGDGLRGAGPSPVPGKRGWVKKAWKMRLRPPRL